MKRSFGGVILRFVRATTEDAHTERSFGGVTLRFARVALVGTRTERRHGPWRSGQSSD